MVLKLQQKVDTTRQLEALIHLSQARAKACFREFVLKEDALDVVESLKRSVEQVHTDEFGIVDRSRGKVIVNFENNSLTSSIRLLQSGRNAHTIACSAFQIESIVPSVISTL